MLDSLDVNIRISARPPTNSTPSQSSPSSPIPPSFPGGSVGSPSQSGLLTIEIPRPPTLAIASTGPVSFVFQNCTIYISLPTISGTRAVFKIISTCISRITPHITHSSNPHASTEHSRTCPCHHFTITHRAVAKITSTYISRTISHIHHSFNGHSSTHHRYTFPCHSSAIARSGITTDRTG
jgi:hypothetical protein